MASSTARAPTALDMFRARCEARASLYASGEIEDLHEAVDELQRHAEHHGLIPQYGQDHIQHVIAKAFRRARVGELPP